MVQRAILITGCSSGIGLDAARTLKARGWRVLATARTPEDLERLETDEGLEAIELELADPSSVEACAQEALRRTSGKLFAVFNNGAYGQVGAVEDLSADLLRRQLEVNLIGTHELTRLIIPSMRENNEGRIVQCSSVLGLVVRPGRGAYCVSKFALEALSDALRVELSETNIHVSIIEPGAIRTRFVETALANFKETIDIEGSVHRDVYRARLEQMEAGGQKLFKGEPADVTKRLVHALESRRPKARYFVTAQTQVAAALKRALPTRILDYLVGKF